MPPEERRAMCIEHAKKLEGVDVKLERIEALLNRFLVLGNGTPPLPQQVAENTKAIKRIGSEVCGMKRVAFKVLVAALTGGCLTAGISTGTIAKVVEAFLGGQ